MATIKRGRPAAPDPSRQSKRSKGSAHYKISIPSAGGYDKLQVVTLEQNDTLVSANVSIEGISAAELVVVRIVASGVNYADVCIRWGLYESAKKFVGWPITPGFEFAGIVESVGSNVAKFSVGDRVFGGTLFGAYSTTISVPQKQLFHLPEQLTMEEGAAFPAVSLTAWYAMFQLAHPRKGSRILVHSAAGGVGSVLVQLGKLAGCFVVGVVGGSHKVAHCRALGCDAVIDKSSCGGNGAGLWEEARARSPTGGYDVIFDANGVSTLAQSYEHLSPGGKLVVYGFHSMLPRRGGVLGIRQWVKMAWDYCRTPRFNPLTMTSANKSVLAFNLSFMFKEVDLMGQAMAQMMRWLTTGDLCVAKVTSFPMRRVADAHRAIESGQTVGKLVLTTGFHPDADTDADAAAAAAKAEAEAAAAARAEAAAAAANALRARPPLLVGAEAVRQRRAMVARHRAAAAAAAASASASGHSAHSHSRPLARQRQQRQPLGVTGAPTTPSSGSEEESEGEEDATVVGRVRGASGAGEEELLPTASPQ